MPGVMDSSFQPQTVPRAVFLYLLGSSHATGCRDQELRPPPALGLQGAAASGEGRPHPRPGSRRETGPGPSLSPPKISSRRPQPVPSGGPSRAHFPVHGEARCRGRFAAGHLENLCTPGPVSVRACPLSRTSFPGASAGSATPLRRAPRSPALTRCLYLGEAPGPRRGVPAPAGAALPARL